MKSFALGQVVATRAVTETFTTEYIRGLIDRHESGDWGNLSDEDKHSNMVAISCGDRILSAYDTCEGKVFVITEFDRSYTTLIFANEY